MSTYIPGSGLKKPLNQLNNPIFPDIKKGPPRFLWSRKHWTVDTGRTQMQVEHIPQLQENAVLFQSKDYNKQHAYGNFPKYTTFVNKEFRPPLIERDDILPLSRIPRPVIIPRINPGTAHSSGNSSFSQQNMSLPETAKYLSDRVKEGEIRPTFFAPIEMPEDNSVLPDLEMKLPSISASAGYAFPSAMDTFHNNSLNDLELEYKSLPVSSSAGYKTTNLNAYNAFQDAQLDYKSPQVSADAGYRTSAKGLTEINFEDELQYNRPQISANAGYRASAKGLTEINFEDEFQYNRPQISATSGYSGYKNSSLNNGTTPTDIFLDKKVEGTQENRATSTFSPLYIPENRTMQNSATNLTNEKEITHYSYIVPSNTVYQNHNYKDNDRSFKKKQHALGNQFSVKGHGHIRRSGLDTPQVKLGKRKA